MTKQSATEILAFAPGTVVKNRGRLWRVDGQEEDVLIATAIDTGEPEQLKFYIPFEDIRPGRLEPPSPDIVGHPAAQDLLLRAYRLSLLHGTAPLLSLQRSRVIPKDYHLAPVVMALEMPRVRMLIADDVGLGKTIEAGLIITELLARQMASRLLVIVPANLREQWREALDYFFHIPARIISSRHRREMERELPAGANPWEHYRFLITSVDYAKQPAIKNVREPGSRQRSVLSPFTRRQDRRRSCATGAPGHQARRRSDVAELYGICQSAGKAGCRTLGPKLAILCSRKGADHD